MFNIIILVLIISCDSESILLPLLIILSSNTICIVCNSNITLFKLSIERFWSTYLVFWGVGSHDLNVKNIIRRVIQVSITSYNETCITLSFIFNFLGLNQLNMD